VTGRGAKPDRMKAGFSLRRPLATSTSHTAFARSPALQLASTVPIASRLCCLQGRAGRLARKKPRTLGSSFTSLKEAEVRWSAARHSPWCDETAPVRVLAAGVCALLLLGGRA
jgi:hypothetical protein